MTTKIQIEVGMFFDHPDDNSTWLVIEEGNFLIENGIRIPIGNPLKNKWWIQKIGSDDPPILACFEFDREQFNFRRQMK